DPDMLMRAAKIAGIGRGVDLVLYVALLAGVASLFVIHLRFRRLDQQLTEVVRHLAISEALRERDAAVHAGDSQKS
ncbi:MAG: hypothetical protein JWO56_39, partial [Acidobacteria bacterium]|nr:hypothetical protein [Acidobacteriota bacterium]